MSSTYTRNLFMVKIRDGFVSNSSSSSFIITNKTTTEKYISDFALENIHLLYEFNKEYSFAEVSLEDFLSSIKKDYANKILDSGETYCTFGDEDGTPLGQVYDYILRDGGESENFKWKFQEFLR